MNDPRGSHRSPSSGAGKAKSADSNHENQCFVVMPFGRDGEEKKWFRGWYEAVIQPAVEACGLESVLAANEEQPSAINDDIRSHLAFDPMVVVDLGGVGPEDPPNPNVMYELGIRHAFGKPLVLMAWEGQRLPFVVNNQRAILSERAMVDIKPTKEKLVAFIQAAQRGKFYNPMEAVSREAALDVTSQALGEESLLKALTEEVRDLRGEVASLTSAPPPRRMSRVRSLLPRDMEHRVFLHACDRGFSKEVWHNFLNAPLDSALAASALGWSEDDWKELFDDYSAHLSRTVTLKGLAGLPPKDADDGREQ